jgi:hypothetical protein
VVCVSKNNPIVLRLHMFALLWGCQHPSIRLKRVQRMLGEWGGTKAPFHLYYERSGNEGQKSTRRITGFGRKKYGGEGLERHDAVLDGVLDEWSRVRMGKALSVRRSSLQDR